MSQKRSRRDFEADLQAQQSPFVHYGTALPPLDPSVRDDGSYVPIWMQEVRDERGRKRLHGAFTGGWSAGYFNTVGSKEGWTPSTFVSSRKDRQKDKEQKERERPRQSVQDFMDEEDLADAADNERLKTAGGFAGLGSTEEDGLRRGGLADLFKGKGETMGVKLLRRMGWKDGQGIGPKVRRKARLELGSKHEGAHDGAETHLFAPENVAMIAFIRKLDRKGLGFSGESRLTSMAAGPKADAGESSDDDAGDGPLIRPRAVKKEKKNKFGKGGIGIGILNETGSDDDDPYEIGPKISYNRIIGGDKKKKKAASTSVNPALRSAPVFISQKSKLAKSGKNLRKCHDGRLPLDGFVFDTESDTLTSTINSTGKYPPPQIPEGWKPSKQREADIKKEEDFISTADAAKASKLDPKSRAALLGEAQLPGKSVFDFLSPAAREKLANASGKSNLPPALGEIPAEYALTDAERQQEVLRQLPELDKMTAIAAITRGASGAAPYADDDAKRGRYRAYLEHIAGFVKTPPVKPAGMKIEDWTRELHEFIGCARIFKPMTGAMASRFTTSSSSVLNNGSSGKAEDADLVSRPPPKPADPAEEAARMGMYGSMTRSVADFYPTRLLCKRFNVPPPVHVQPDTEGGGARASAAGAAPASAGAAVGGMPGFASSGYQNFGPAGAGGAMTLDELMKQAQSQGSDDKIGPDKDGSQGRAIEAAPVTQEEARLKEVEVQPDVNDALEGKRAQDEVLRAIFGESSDEEDD
ncbi:DUF1604-domain-containing protein [Xylariaceae sp. FL0016]|nr:DUF1604-domain-containing protein [Xylariaceae sp. FL0016]